MAINYARELPQDKNNQRYDDSPPTVISNQSQNGVPATSSVITFNDKTTVVRMTVVGGAAANSAILYKWGSGSVTGTNFDGVIQSGETKMVVIPQSVMASYSVAGANVSNGLYTAMAVKIATAQSASVFTSEY